MMMMDNKAHRITYNDMEMRFGKKPARDLLLCLERMARIQSDILHIDADRRLEKALSALNALNDNNEPTEKFLA